MADEKELWDFRCQAALLSDGRYRVRLTSASGRVIERIGYHPLHELIRALGINAKEK